MAMIRDDVRNVIKQSAHEIYNERKYVVPILKEEFRAGEVPRDPYSIIKHFERTYGDEYLTVLPAAGAIARILEDHPEVRYTKWGYQLRRTLAASIAGKLQRIASQKIYLPADPRKTISVKWDNAIIVKQTHKDPYTIDVDLSPTDALIVSEEGTTVLNPVMGHRGGTEFKEHLLRYPLKLHVVVPELNRDGETTGRLVRLRVNPQHPYLHEVPYREELPRNVRNAFETATGIRVGTYAELRELLKSIRARKGLNSFRADEIIALRDLLRTMSTKMDPKAMSAVMETVVNGTTSAKYANERRPPYAVQNSKRIPLYRYRHLFPPAKVIVPILNRFGDPAVVEFRRT